MQQVQIPKQDKPLNMFKLTIGCKSGKVKPILDEYL